MDTDEAVENGTASLDEKIMKFRFVQQWICRFGKPIGSILENRNAPYLGIGDHCKKICIKGQTNVWNFIDKSE